jgi:hypothetical protein
MIPTAAWIPVPVSPMVGPGFFALRVLEIQGNALLVRVQRHEVGAVHAWAFLPTIAPRVSALRFLNLDHISA